MIRLVVDVKQRRPACALLQAEFGGDYRLVHMLPVESWLTSPTPDMKMLTGTRGEWERFGDELRAAQRQSGEQETKR